MNILCKSYIWIGAYLVQGRVFIQPSVEFLFQCSHSVLEESINEEIYTQSSNAKKKEDTTNILQKKTVLLDGVNLEKILKDTIEKELYKEAMISKTFFNEPNV